MDLKHWRVPNLAFAGAFLRFFPDHRRCHRLVRGWPAGIGALGDFV